MNTHIKRYIEQNMELLEEDIVKFVMLLPGGFEKTDELYFMLKTAGVDIPDKLTHMVGILDVYNRYYGYSYNIGEQLEDILEDNEASEDDSGQYGFLTGMSDENLRKAFNSFKDVLKNMIGDEDYYIYPETLQIFNM